MKLTVESFLACESLRLEGDLYYLLAGGMSAIRVAAFPASTNFSIASRLSITDIGEESSVRFSVVVLTDDGEDLLNGSFNPVLLLTRESAERSSIERYNLPLYFRSIIFPKPGNITISLRWNGEEIARTGFDVHA